MILALQNLFQILFVGKTTSYFSFETEFLIVGNSVLFLDCGRCADGLQCDGRDSCLNKVNILWKGGFA